MTASTRSTTGTVTVPGAAIAYDEAGDGPPLVLIHAGVADRSVWNGVWDAFADRHRVIRYDTRGFGETRVTADVPYSNRADLIAVLDHLGIERAAVVGASRSGQIALDTAVESPERFAALISVAGGLSGAELEPTPEEEPIWAEAERLEAARDHAALGEFELKLWYDGFLQPETRLDPAIRAFGREMISAIYRDHADEPLEQVIRLDPPAAGRLADVRIPTLVLVGDLDTPESIATARLIADGIPGARLEVWQGVAHMPSLERPAAFVQLVEGFLAER